MREKTKDLRESYVQEYAALKISESLIMTDCRGGAELNGRWVLLAAVGVMTIVSVVGFGVKVFDWLDVAFVAFLTALELRTFVTCRQLPRLLIVAPLIIMIVLVSPLNHFLSAEGRLVLRGFGVAVIVLYFAYKHKLRNRN